MIFPDVRSSQENEHAIAVEMIRYALGSTSICDWDKDSRDERPEMLARPWTKKCSFRDCFPIQILALPTDYPPGPLARPPGPVCYMQADEDRRRNLGAQSWVDIPIDEISRRAPRSPRFQASINNMARDLLSRDLLSLRNSSHSSSQFYGSRSSDVNSPPGPIYDWSSPQNPSQVGASMPLRGQFSQ